MEEKIEHVQENLEIIIIKIQLNILNIFLINWQGKKFYSFIYI